MGFVPITKVGTRGFHDASYFPGFAAFRSITYFSLAMAVRVSNSRLPVAGPTTETSVPVSGSIAVAFRNAPTRLNSNRYSPPDPAMIDSLLSSPHSITLAAIRNLSASATPASRAAFSSTDGTPEPMPAATGLRHRDCVNGTLFLNSHNLFLDQQTSHAFCCAAA